MSIQELLTFLLNAISLGFIIIATMDFGTRLVVAYKQVSSTLNSPSTSTQKPISKLPLAVKQQELDQLPDPWLLPVAENPLLLRFPSPEFFKREDKAEIVSNILVAQKEPKHLRLLPPAKTIDVFNPELEDLLRGVDLDKLKLRQARKVAKVLGIAQKVNGKDQKLNFLKSQILLKLQQAESETVQVVKKELLAC